MPRSHNWLLAIAVSLVTALGGSAQEAAPDAATGTFKALSVVERYWEWRWKGDATIQQLSACPFSLDGKEILDDAGLKAKLPELERGAAQMRKKVTAIDVLRVDFIEYDAESFKAQLEPHADALGSDYERVLSHATQLLGKSDLCLIMKVRLHRRGKSITEEASVWLLLSRTAEGYRVRGFQVS